MLPIMRFEMAGVSFKKGIRFVRRYFNIKIVSTGLAPGLSAFSINKYNGKYKYVPVRPLWIIVANFGDNFEREKINSYVRKYEQYIQYVSFWQTTHSSYTIFDHKLEIRTVTGGQN